MRLSCTIVLWLALAGSARAATIDFTQLTFGPTDAVSIGGVSIAVAPVVLTDSALFSSLAGVGLGVVGGTSDNLADLGEGEITLQTEGVLTSLTLQPFMTADGHAVDASQFVQFPMSLRVRDPLLTFEEFEPVFLSFAPLVIDLTDRGREFPTWAAFGMNGTLSLSFSAALTRTFPGQAVRFGFALTSLDYTPIDTPEPPILPLVVLGGAGLWWMRRHGQGAPEV